MFKCLKVKDKQEATITPEPIQEIPKYEKNEEGAVVDEYIPN